MSDDARSLVAFQEKLAVKRSNFESWWDSIAQRVLPAEATFTTTTEEGTPRTERLFSGKPVTCNERFAAVLDELLTPSTQEWHGLIPEDTELAEDHEARVYLERLTKLLFAKRYTPKANFAAQRHQGYLSVGAFGNSNMFIDEDLKTRGPRYRHIPLKESYWALNHVGLIDCMYRRYVLTAKQAQQDGAEQRWQLPAEITKALEKDPLKEFEFLHVVKPNDDRKYGRLDSSGMPWQSFYIALCDKEQILSTGGYRSWPYATGRYMVHGREAYGHSPAMSAWPGILTLNEEKKTVLRAGQKVVDPPILLSEEGALEPFNLRSGALNPGMVSANGSPLALAFETKGQIPLGVELMGIENAEIEESFLVSVFRMLMDPRMTAAQVYELAAQKATVVAPAAQRLRSEDLGMLIEREIDILSQDTANRWILEEMPDALRESGGAYKIDYRSPLARAMRANDAVAILRTLEVIPTAAGIDQSAALVYDIPKMVRELGEINGVPAKLTRSPDEVERLAEQQRQAAALSAAAEVAQPLSQAALNAAKAEESRAA